MTETATKVARGQNYEMQTQALSLKNTGIVTTSVGNPTDIHPKETKSL